MAVGQVSFHKQKSVKRIFVPTRKNEIINRLNKTKVENTIEYFVEERQILESAITKEKKAAAKILV